MDKIKDIIKELKDLLGKEVIDKIMGTHKDYYYGIKFLEFLGWHGKLDIKEITHKLDIANPRLIEFWYRRYPPRPIITLLNIYFKNYHKISKKNLAYLFGWGFGDGGLRKDLSSYFICGKKQDLLQIEGHFNNNIPSLPVTIEENFGNSSVYQANGKIKHISSNDSWILWIKDSSFSKLLYALGLPKGEKVLQPTNIPHWIKQGDKQVKKGFLNALFEGELQTHRVHFNVKRNKIDICPITFGLSKIEKYKEDLVNFLEDIRDMLQEFQINSTSVENPKLSNIRKRDGLITYSTRFYISISALNTIRFSEFIDFPFNQEKRIAIQKAVEEARRKIKNMELQITKYKKALELFHNGRSIYKISKELDIRWHTANNWLITKKHLPVLLSKNLSEVSNGV
ncbi:hypothetical protein HYU50_01575 [Candidatus Woesearchaeota archaeon]|nr:hypothetical protein [Candidatus Woesearchaeota archaeon]